jgi:hypothetical protein
MQKLCLVLALFLAPFPVFAQSQAASAPPPWYERIRFGGDFRSRYEGFYQEDAETRNRVRMRLRLRVDTDINDDVRFQLQVASGDSGTPVSTNQTFTSFFLPKPFNLNRAYIAYNAAAAPALTLGIGKFNAPQTVTQLTFDEDLNFEGGWEQVSWEPREGLGINLVALQTAVNEVSRARDAYMLGGYGEVSIAFGQHSLQFSAANYAWGNEDQIAVASAGGPLESILTNGVRRGPAGNVIGYTSEFNVVDLIAEAAIRTGRAAYPLRLLADFAHNTKAATDRSNGLWIEAEYGSPRPTGTWGAGYTYAWVEQDATPSAFVFSDMPGTNLRLHMLETSYVVKTGLSLDATLHLTKQLILEQPNDPNHWLSRLHLAAVVRF